MWERKKDWWVKKNPLKHLQDITQPLAALYSPVHFFISQNMTRNKRKADCGWICFVFGAYGLPQCCCCCAPERRLSSLLFRSPDLRNPWIEEGFCSFIKLLYFSAGWRERVYLLKCCFFCTWRCFSLSQTVRIWKVGSCTLRSFLLNSRDISTHFTSDLCLWHWWISDL